MFNYIQFNNYYNLIINTIRYYHFKFYIFIYIYDGLHTHINN